MLIRIISAFVGILIGVSVLLFDNLYLYVGVLSVIGTIGVWEVIHAIKCDKHKPLMYVCLCVSAVIPSLLCLDIPGLSKRLLIPIVTAAFVFALLMIMLNKHKSIRLENVASCGSAAVVIPLSLSSIVFVRGFEWYADGGYFPGVFMLVYILFCAWFGDSGAYFVGTFLGKHKLCPEISPKKTVEGFIGGIVTVGIVAAIQCAFYNEVLFRFFEIGEQYKMSYAVLVPVSMVTSIVGVLGDLTASVIKRQYDVKDFGNLMPGHGGVLDRFDSVLFVAPFLYAVFSLLSPLQN